MNIIHEEKDISSQKLIRLFLPNPLAIKMFAPEMQIFLHEITLTDLIRTASMTTNQLIGPPLTATSKNASDLHAM